jgi:hypothetical protein
LPSGKGGVPRSGKPRKRSNKRRAERIERDISAGTATADDLAWLQARKKAHRHTAAVKKGMAVRAAREARAYRESEGLADRMARDRDP